MSVLTENEIRLVLAGIAFSITSGRPPLGLKMLVAPLALNEPFAAFNGGILIVVVIPNAARNLLFARYCTRSNAYPASMSAANNSSTCSLPRVSIVISIAVSPKSTPKFRS